MSITISTLGPPLVPFKLFSRTTLGLPGLPLNLSSQTCLRAWTRNPILLRSSPNRTQSFNLEHTPNFSGLPANNLGFSFGRNLGFVAKAENAEGERKNNLDEAEQAARGQSTMPERFRYLTKEAPDRPMRWPYLIALAFLVYAWRTVLWELYNWKKTLVGIVLFLGYLSKLALGIIFHFIGDPITSLIRGIETGLYTVRAIYSGIVAYAPVPELTMIIILASSVLAIAEATISDSVNGQPYLLTLAGLIGFAAVRGFISELFFWMLLLGLFAFARFIKKKDYVSSALPVATVLAAVGEPWVRVVVMSSYLALAIIHHSKHSEGQEGQATTTGKGVPIPLLCAALAIGLRVAAKWVGYRHLTWMIV